MNGYHSKQPRFWRGLSAAIGLTGILLWPTAVLAQNSNRRTAQSQPLSWARIDFLNNVVRFVPRQARSRPAKISDILGIGDAIRTYEAANAELRFNDGSMARIGERATFRFTPNTRNFQLSDGTALLLIPPGRGRTTIQTPNAVTGIQGSALFVRYIEETDTTIVGALTNNPEGPMILYNEDGTEQQALYANEMGVVKGDRITELYQFDGELFWESSGLAEGFDYTEEGSTGVDDLDGVRQEIREAIASQDPLEGDDVVENPDVLSRPEIEEPPAQLEEIEESPTESLPEETEESPQSEANGTADSASADDPSMGVEPSVENETDDASLTIVEEEVEDPDIEFEGSPAEEYLNPKNKPTAEPETGVTNSLAPVPLTEEDPEEEEASEPETPNAGSERPSNGNLQPGAGANSGSNGNERPDTTSRPGANNRPGRGNRPNNSDEPVEVDTTPGEEVPITEGTLLPTVPDSTDMPIESPTTGAGNGSDPVVTPVEGTEGLDPLPPSALQENPNEPAVENPVENPDDAVINQPDAVIEPTDGPVIDSAEPTPTEALPAGPSAEPTIDAEPAGAAGEMPEIESEVPVLPEDSPMPTEAVAPVVPEEAPAPIDTEAIEVPIEPLPPETISGESPADVMPELDTTIPEPTAVETVIPEETVILEETVIPEETLVPDTAEPVIPETSLTEEAPSQLVEEAVPFTVEQNNDLPDVQEPENGLNDQMEEMQMEQSENQDNSPEATTDSPVIEQPNTDVEQPTNDSEGAPILL